MSPHSRAVRLCDHASEDYALPGWHKAATLLFIHHVSAPAVSVQGPLNHEKLGLRESSSLISSRTFRILVLLDIWQ